MQNQESLSKPPADGVDGAESTRSGRCYRPHVDILERGDELLVLADVPGAQGDKIDVNFEDGMLTIHAPVEPRQRDDCEFLLGEYGVGDFCRSFRISEAIDASKISAGYADGVLTLHLPKAEAVKPRKINVSTK